MLMMLRKVSWNKGQTDSGIAYDYTRITCDLPIYEDSPREFGVDSMELEYGNADKHAELLSLKGRLPCEVDVGYKDVKKGKNIIKVVTGFKVVEKPILSKN